MNITRLVEKIFVGLFLTVTLMPLQSCSNTQIGEKLENSFDIRENSTISNKAIQVQVKTKPNEIKKIKLVNNDNAQEKITISNSISSKDRFSQKSSKSKKKVIFNPQPYRIIIKLSGANPSAPAETVTKALIKAGVEFEVEKIERFDEKSLLNDSSLKR